MSDATWDPDATRTPGSGAPEVTATRLVGRYVLGELLGRGGTGQVHEAVDTLTGDTVAVKFVRAMSATDHRVLRRERTALRLLDLPGVARLRDDGQLGGQSFLVMDLLPGGPISGLAGPYARWADAARTLAETLSRVHYAGVVHRDLKPGNILLDAQQRPVITDFGLAQGAAVERSGGTREGTPRYMPPEQWAGHPCDARSDLYALGVVLWELATDRRFPEHGTGREAMGTTDIPDALRAMILRLTEPDPARRPASAQDVLDALGGGDAVLGPLPPLPDPVPRDVLEALVDEAQPSFLHLADDVATLLLQRSGGAPERVAAELASWIRAGRCHWDQGRLRIDPAAVAALHFEQELPPLTGDDDAVAAAALEASDRAWNDGQAHRALVLLESVLDLVESPGPARDLRHRMAARSLHLHDATHVRRALYRAERAGDTPLVGLLQGARLCLAWEPARAEEALRAVVGLPDELEVWRLAVLRFALVRHRPEAQDALLASSEAWCAQEPLRRARWLGWRGSAHYAAGRYAEALADHQTSAEALVAHPVERLTALNNAAAAALETGRPEHAAPLAAEARALAASMRHPIAESGATVLMRTAAYRAGSTTAPEPGWVQAASAVAPAHEAQLALTEAAVAWRSGAPEGLALAQRAARVYAALGHPGQALALALAAALGAPTEPGALVALARALPDPSLALQTVALGAPQAAAEVPVATWAAAWHLPDPTARGDVLSLAECRARLRS